MSKCPENCTCGRHRSKGVQRSAETRARISAAKMGHEVSAETREKIGSAARGRVASPETRNAMSESHRRHGHNTRRSGRTPEYRAWDAMKQRCHNPRSRQYAQYGARGIYVCDRWRNSFENFLADMGPRPSASGVRYSVDRIDNDGPYSPENCRWATMSEQNRNRPNFNPNKRG